MVAFQMPFRLLGLLLLLALCPFPHAYDLSERRAPQGDLKVRLDYDLALPGPDGDEGQHRWAFSTYLKFNEDVSSVSKGQLVKLAIDAWNEMKKDSAQYDMEKKKGNIRYLPYVMTVMAFDKEIILSSSQKGRGGFISEVPDSPVMTALEECQRRFHAPNDLENVPEDGNQQQTEQEKQWHKSNAGCGEIFAFHRYYQIHDKEIKSLDPKARVTTVNKKGVMDPCGTGDTDKWGCNLLVEVTEVDYIFPGVEPEPYDLEEIAGGVDRIGQIQSCSGNSIRWST